jgi:hypothetical protein
MVTAELSAAKTVVSNFSYSRTTPKVEVTDGNNNVLAKGYANPQDKIEIEAIVVDSATPGTVAGAQANLLLPVAGSTVTLAATGASTYIDGDWTFDGEGGITPSKSDAWKIKLTLVRTGPPTGNVPGVLSPVS